MNMTKSLRLATGFGLISSLAVLNKDKVHNLFGQREKQTHKTKIFIWGNGEYQARPDVGIQFRNFEPKQIEEFDSKKFSDYNFQKIHFGEFHEAGLDEKGALYVWKAKKLLSFKDANNKDNSREGLVKLTKEGITQVGFTKGFIWALDNKGTVHSWPIHKEVNDYKEVVDTKVIDNKQRQIKTLPSNIKQIATGEDHFVALTDKGEVYTMGDDTYGQCGLGADSRSSAPPYYDKRIRNPQKIESLQNIKKIVAGHNHSLALSEDGVLYGWGSNSHVQLSHEREYSKVDNPLMAMFEPVRFSANIQSNIVTDMAAGENSTFIVTQNKDSKQCEVFSCGYNINGQLGLGYLRHVSDVSKIDALSNYTHKHKDTKKEENVTIKQISCGANHCMVLLNIGAVMEWGQNEYGQLGNKKRVFSENPFILGKFTGENVLDVNCGWNQSSVVTERREDQQKK